MSLRRPRQAPGADVHADQLRAELQALKETAIAFEVANSEAIAADGYRGFTLSLHGGAQPEPQHDADPHEASVVS